MTAIEDEARTVEVRTQERGRESWAISLTTATSSGGFTDTIRMTEAEARAVYAALGERLSAPPSDDDREALAYLITAFRFRERGIPGRIGEPDLAIARPLADFLTREGFRRQVPITKSAALKGYYTIPERQRKRLTFESWLAALEAAERARSAVPSTEREQP